MSHVLICGAAGYTNLGDDAILWGMLTQLREALGERPVRVAGGPELARLLGPFGAAAVSYEDRSELARAIEDADLVILGGGGMMYDVAYDAGLARFLTEPDDRQWLYELAKIAAAARAAARPIMVYGMGAGPLVTDLSRRVARFIGQESQVVTVRDRASADLLADCGLPRGRVHVAGDPALAVAPGSEDAAREFVEKAGFAAAPRPWVAVNLRPWHRFGGVDAGSAGAREQFVARSGELLRLLCERLQATAVLLPFQRLNDDDRDLLGEVLSAAGNPDGALAAELALSPPEVVAALAQFDLMVGMRLHSLVLAMNAGVPFVGLTYDAKVAEFARAAGLGEHAQAVDALDPVAAVESCERLLDRRKATSAALAKRHEEMAAAAGLSAELAAWLLDRSEGRPRPTAPMVAPGAQRTEPIRVLMQIRADYRDASGGDTVQMTETRRRLEGLGVEVELTTETAPDLSAYDLVHTFNLGRPEEPYQHCLNAALQGKPVALSTVYADFGEMWEWADTDYWELPPPETGLPEPRRAPPVEPTEARRRVRLEEQRQAAIDWATVYLPNGQGEADYLHAAHRMDLARSVAVPNAAAPIFFDARPEAFAAKYGLKDFVLCAARVEKRKNQLALVAALRGTGLPLVIIGRANPEGYRDLCRRYADENVHFVDEISHEELASAYAAAKVHALVGWFETPGLSTLEAAAAGCNVVSTDRGLAREYLGDMAWYCDPMSVESIRKAVVAAHEAPRSDRLKEHVGRNYTWERAAERTLEAYRLALSLREAREPAERREEMLAVTRRHADWLARLAADRQYETQRERELRAELEEWALGLRDQVERLEQELARLREEMGLVTSRRLYRWSDAVARGTWGLLRALRIKR